MLLNCGAGEDSWESLGLQGDPTSPFWRRSVLGVYWKDWCWSWNSNTLATWCKELTHLKRPGCWERLKARRKGDDRGWDGCMVSPTLWTWVWANSGSWWWTGKPSVLQSMRSQRVGHDWATNLTCLRIPSSDKRTVVKTWMTRFRPPFWWQTLPIRIAEVGSRHLHCWQEPWVSLFFAIFGDTSVAQLKLPPC